MGSVFVIGDLNVDVLCRTGRLPKKGEEIHAESIGFSIGGNAANFAVVLGRLGAGPEFYSCMGNDFSSEFLRGELERAGVKQRLKEVTATNGVTVCTVFPEGERGFISNKGASGMLRVQDIRPILKNVKPGDIVYSGGLFHLPGLARGFAGFLRDARKKGATVMLDYTFDETGCSGSFRDIATQLDMVFLNERELEAFGNGKKAFSKLSGMGIRDIIVKLGARGSLFCTNGMVKKEPARKVKALDTTGAGDVFNAGFVYGFMSGFLPEQCLRLGNWMAAWKVGKSGLQTPPREKVSDFVKKL
ncbi:MAG: carbohydrate kinase family protein [Candidatus Aenigmarchaeota archaeon]|nr:carbohydrate kinase family protein [Candidatus Aenigmarchaeota archaeon]